MDKKSFWKDSVLVNLAYYDIFDFPLTDNELLKYSSQAIDPSQFSNNLSLMVKQNLIYEHEGYFSIQKNVKDLSERREQGEIIASKKMNTASKYTQVLSKIPFIESICLSGSISKGVMYENSDIDYFLIAASGKVWRTKFLVVAFRILFLFNSRKNFCVNYIIDKDHLLLEEKNRFTATELVTMIPMYGYEYYQNILRLNSWTNYFYKDLQALTSKHTILKNQKTITSNLISLTLDNRFGEWLENWFMEFSKKRYRQKFKDKISEEYLDLAFKSTPYVSKSHGMNFQEQVYNRFMSKIETIEIKNNIVIKDYQFYYEILNQRTENPYA